MLLRGIPATILPLRLNIERVVEPHLNLSNPTYRIERNALPDTQISFFFNLKVKKYNFLKIAFFLLMCINLGSGIVYFLNGAWASLETALGIYFLAISLTWVPMLFFKCNLNCVHKLGLLHLLHSLFALGIQLCFHISLFLLERKKSCHELNSSFSEKFNSPKSCTDSIPSHFLSAIFLVVAQFFLNLLFILFVCSTVSRILFTLNSSSVINTTPRFTSCSRLSPYSVDEYFSTLSAQRVLDSPLESCTDASLLFYHFPELLPLPKYSPIILENEWRVIDVEQKVNE